jgi:predicted RNA-binding protein with PIN domain
MPVIIDGHNLLWAVSESGARTEAVDELRLCHIISRYLKSVGDSGQIVFDGVGPRDEPGFDTIGNLGVVFSGSDRDADTVIEDKIKADTAPRRLTVVSSDRRLRAAARARKATAVKSQVFWSNLRRRLNQPKTAKEPPAKRNGLTETETEQWLKFFGLKQ